nr:unnamed protein product [Digitaria exilis]
MGRRGRKGKGAAAAGGSGGGGISEATLVRITKALEDFRASDAQDEKVTPRQFYLAVYTFEPDLSNQERGAIHNMCRKMGMKSKSSGSGEQRCVSVYKCKKKQKPDMKKGPNHLGFSEEARHVLQDLFTHYPPDDADLNGDPNRNFIDKAANIKWKTDSPFSKPTMSKLDITKKVEMLASKINGNAQLRKIMENKSKLPITSFKDVITSTLENHQVLFFVVLISGETGCGKTTQVPQYILDHMWGKGKSCKIICTQPRRISAISVAERISAERGEAVGDTVGYKIRLESKGGKNSSVMFCTNGVLLRDEIHERDRFSDFMLTILRSIQYCIQQVLMSATMDAARFSQYFNGCPVIQVPGFTYPVKLLDPNCKIADFLNKTLDPPIPETLRNAISVLQDLGALTQGEQLTELGEKLGSLPVHPSTTKMLLFAILMNCLDPALTLACAADYRDPFFLPVAPDERKRAAAAKVELASLYGGFSDQLTVVAAFDCWRRAKDRGQESQFCTKYFVSSNIMHMLSNMRKQLRNELSQRGFVPADTSACSLNSKDPGIMRAVLMAGAYPMIGRLLPPCKKAKNAVVETASGAKVRLHPHSCNFNPSFNKSSGNPLVIYDEITRGDGGMYIKKCSVVGSYPLLLVATEMVVAPAANGNDEEEDSSEDEAEKSSLVQHRDEIMSSPDNTVSIVVDRWLRFDATALDVAQIYCLRERLASAILFKVKHPQDVLPAALGASMYAIACILSYDGLPAMVPSNDLPANGSDQNSAEANSFSQGRRTGYIPPDDFLMSLMADKSRRAPHFQNSSNHPGCASAHAQPSRAPVGRFDQSQRSFRNSGPGTGSSAPRSFKRQRNTAW